MDFDLSPAQIELRQRAREAGLRWRGQHASWDRDDVSPYAALTASTRFVPGAPENELYAVFARFDDLPGARGVGCVLIEKDTPGLRLERGAHFVGSRGLPHGEVHFEDCRVPRENLIAGPGSFGRLMSAFNMERIHNSTYSLGFSQAAFDEAVAYVERRKAFGKDIIEFQASYHT